jgi:hypothetical protein
MGKVKYRRGKMWCRYLMHTRTKVTPTCIDAFRSTHRRHTFANIHHHDSSVPKRPNLADRTCPLSPIHRRQRTPDRLVVSRAIHADRFRLDLVDARKWKKIPGKEINEILWSFGYKNNWWWWRHRRCVIGRNFNQPNESPMMSFVDFQIAYYIR